MSYDLTVFASTVLDLEGVARLVDATATLQAEASHPAALTVVRGARRAYCFTVDAPAELDPVDVPPEVTAVTMGVTARYEIRVEGSDEAAVPFARRFGKKLATATAGALHDHQTDEVTTRAGLRRAARPTGTDRIDVVELRWYVVTPVTSDIAEVWLACARAFLPEALPRRFGTDEPFPHELVNVDGVEAFRLETRGRHGVYFSTQFPVISGGISVGEETDGEPGFGSLHLTLARDALFDERWRRSRERFFVAVAERTGSFFSVAQVARNTGWSGRSSGTTAARRRCTTSSTVHGWGCLQCPCGGAGSATTTSAQSPLTSPTRPASRAGSCRSPRSPSTVISSGTLCRPGASSGGGESRGCPTS